MQGNAEIRIYVNPSMMKIVLTGAMLAIALGLSSVVHADASEGLVNLAGVVEQGAENENTSEVLSDHELSAIKGMGMEAQHLEANDQLAVILWDEQGNINRRIKQR